MKAIMNFAFQCEAKFSLNPEFILNRTGRYFLVNKNLRRYIQKDFYYAGTYLGKVKNGKFFPSFNLLTMLANGEANKIVVEKKAAWLFICGRDIFRKGILAVRGSRKKVLVFERWERGRTSLLALCNVDVVCRLVLRRLCLVVLCTF